MTNPDAPLDDEPGRHAAEDRPSLLARWQLTEPVRLALWPVVLAVVALFVGYDLLAPERAPLWVTLAAAVLFGALPATGAALARRQAWAPATVRYTVDAWTDDAYERGAHDALELAEREPDRPRLAGPSTADLPATAESPEARPDAHPATAELKGVRPPP